MKEFLTDLVIDFVKAAAVALVVVTGLISGAYYLSEYLRTLPLL